MKPQPTRNRLPMLRVSLFLFGWLWLALAAADPAPPVGAWSNQAEGFKRQGLVIYESGRGLLNSPVASSLFSWQPLGDGRYRILIHDNGQPTAELRYDASRDQLILDGPSGQKQVFRRLPDAMPADPVQRLVERERAQRDQRWKNFKKRYQRVALGLMQTSDIAGLWERERQKPGFVALIANPTPLAEGIPATPPLLSLSRKREQNFINLTLAAAVDPELPRTAADLTPFRQRPQASIDTTRYLSPDITARIRQLLQQDAISYQEDRFRLEYLQGYRIGFEDRISAHYSDAQMQQTLPRLLQQTAGEHPQLMVYEILRRE